MKGALWCGHPASATLVDERHEIPYCGACSGEVQLSEMPPGAEPHTPQEEPNAVAVPGRYLRLISGGRG